MEKPNRRARRVIAFVCLALPVVALLMVPWFPHDTPRLAGMRFFFWYQLAWVPASVVLMAVAYALRRKAEPPPRDRARRESRRS